MGDRVLLRRAHLRRRPPRAARRVLLDGHEDRVVAEAALAPGLTQEAALHRALDPRDRRPVIRAGGGQYRRAGEAGGAVGVRHVGDLVQQEAQVRRVVTVAAAPAGGEDAGCAAEHVHAQARVVGDGGQAGDPHQGAGLDLRVGREAEPVLHGLGRAQGAGRDDRARVQPGHERREDRPQLGELAGVVGGQDQHGPVGRGHGRRRHAHGVS